MNDLKYKYRKAERKMKVVLLAGGLGTRISEESQFKPKPMIEIGGKPILWHIMKEYSYYGFNDFAYLSSGIVGTFLELCRCTFQYAYFSDKEALLNGKISPEIQTKAALDVANSEFEQIQRISKYGNYVHQFTKNMGNRFAKYHVDKRISYPETNQFCLDSKKLQENSVEDKVFKAAIMWSVIQKKKGMQQASIGKDDEEIYILNRIFSPIFQISVRTRGGFNVEINEQEFIELILREEEMGRIEEDISEENGIGKNEQMSIFDIEWGNIND